MAIWRIRIKGPKRIDHTQKALEHHVVGVWYGAWSARDFIQVRKQTGDKAQIAEALNALPAQQRLGWNVTRDFINTVLRFLEIKSEDWVLTYNDNILNVFRLSSGLKSGDFLKENGEFFKYREVDPETAKQFDLTDLPDVYRLLPSQGRGNIFHIQAMSDQVELLIQSKNSVDLWQRLRARSFPQRLDFLSPPQWEAFCEAYLILEAHYVPTQLSVGRTLPIVDIAGRRFTDGKHILAQCKKSNTPCAIPPAFVKTCQPQTIGYFFSYGGCNTPNLPAHIKVIDRTTVLHWLTTETGQQYRKLLSEPDQISRLSAEQSAIFNY